MRPNLVSGQAVGTVIAVADSSDLAGLSTQGLAVGTKVYNIAVAQYFTLTVSTAALDPDAVVAVYQISNQRWIKDVPAGGVTDVTATFPIQIAGPMTAPVVSKPDWKNPHAFYVSPNGDDSHNGLAWDTAIKTIYHGLELLTGSVSGAVNGGTLYVANGCSVGGPVTGQGIRLRSDWLPGLFFEPLRAKGWLPWRSIRIVGIGNAGGELGTFTQPTPAEFFGGDGTRTNPAIWIVGDLQTAPLSIENFVSASPCAVGGKVGVDYDYDINGDIITSTIASATRTGQSTTYTVTLPAGWAVTACQRASGMTTLTIPNPGVPHPPWRSVFTTADPTLVTNNVPIRFTSGTPGTIGSIDVYLTDSSSALSGNTTWTVTYYDAAHNNPADDIPPGTVITGTVQSHGCCPGEIADTLSNVPNKFQYTQNTVTATTVTTVTVKDTSSQSGDMTVANIGSLAHQERFANGTTGVHFKGIEFNVEQTHIGNGPGLDIGHTQAWRPEIDGGFLQGLVGFPEVDAQYRDDMRMAACLIYPGVANQGPPVSAAYIHDGEVGSGYIYASTSVSSTGVFDVRRMIAEPGGSTQTFPILFVVANAFTTAYGETLQNADILSGVETVKIISGAPGGAIPTALQFYNCALVSGSCIGEGNVNSAEEWIGPDNNPTPWQRRQVSAWADLRISGKHPGPARGMGAAGARFKNIMGLSPRWNLGPNVTLTTDVPGPNVGPSGWTDIDGIPGAPTANRLVSTALSSVALQHDVAYTDSWAANGKFYICGWINLHTPAAAVQGTLFSVTAQNVVWEESGTTTGVIPVPYMGTGWQFVSGFVTVKSVADTPTPTINIFISTGIGTIDLWGLSAAYIPPTVDNNDVFEYLGTLRQQPVYLLPGMVGTMETVKLIGHGGLGTAARYTVGVASGNITLGSPNGNAVEMFDESGNSLGVLALTAFSVNP